MVPGALAGTPVLPLQNGFKGFGLLAQNCLESLRQRNGPKRDMRMIGFTVIAFTTPTSILQSAIIMIIIPGIIYYFKICSCLSRLWNSYFLDAALFIWDSCWYAVAALENLGMMSSKRCFWQPVILPG